MRAGERLGGGGRPDELVNAFAASESGPTVDRTTYQERLGSPPRGLIVFSRPTSTSRATASRDCSATPRPTSAAFLMAPFEPSVSTGGWS